MPKIVDPEKKRHFLAEAACRAIVRKGIVGVTMNDIASEARVTTGMIANYFDNKDAIISAALRAAFQNVEAQIARRISRGEGDLAELLDPAIPASKRHVPDVAVWVNFWGLIASNPELRQKNGALHEEGLAVYGNAMRAAWPESTGWPEDVFLQVRRSIVIFLFGLSAGGITNPAKWTQRFQRDSLRLHLDVMRAWANRENGTPQ